MLFSIHAIDKPGAAKTREAVHADHLAHLKRASDYKVTLVAGGPLVSDDGATPIGSMMLVEAPDRAAAEAFNRA
ncbi:MAG TPA: YciI family protein, partial [Pseudolabrys sp.]|nr:YciI family protein [Pseudolabrys sp.]